MSVNSSFFLFFLFAVICSASLFGQDCTDISADGCAESKIYNICVPTIEDDTWDGLADGEETHRIFRIYPVEGTQDSYMKHGYLKIESTVEVCDERAYGVAYVEPFNGDALDSKVWVTGYRNPEPLDIVVSIDEGRALAYPEFVEVSDGLLKLHIRNLEDSPERPSTIEFTDDQGNTSIVDASFGAGAVTTNNNKTPNRFNPIINTPINAGMNGGCLKYGRYTINAKALNSHDEKYIRSALWFFGVAGEVDIFEQCMPNCNEMQTTIHRWGLDDGDEGMNFEHIVVGNNGLDPVDHARISEETTDVGLYSGRFVDYQFEWTPFDMTLRIDGNDVLSLNRYYKFVPGNCEMVALDCSEINAAIAEDNLWETMMWHKFRDHYMDLIFSTDVFGNKIPATIDETFEINYVLFEHKMNSGAIDGPDLVCPSLNSAVAEFSIELDDVISRPLSWEVNDPEVVFWSSTSEVSIELRVPELEQDKFILDLETDNEMNCLGAKFQKEVFVGAPTTIDFTVNDLGCGNVIIYGDYPHEISQYSWDIEPTNSQISLSVETGENWMRISPNDPKITGGYGFQYSVTVSNECGSKKFSSFYWVSDCKPKHVLKLFQNPISDVLKYEVEGYHQSIMSFNLNLIDMNGEVEYSGLSNGYGELPVSNLKPGTYFLHLIDQNSGEITSSTVIKN